MFIGKLEVTIKINELRAIQNLSLVLLRKTVPLRFGEGQT